ncbi:MAG: sodium:solute symporter family protein [Acidobacteriota bacterium]
MYVYLYLILGYLLVLMAFNFYRSRQIKSHEDFMVAGRTLSLRIMVFTLICTWIGSGTFIAGAEYAARAGWSSLWLPAGAWFGIAVIYFLAGKIRTFGQYTIGDILEVRYGKFARVFGAIALVIAFTTIVSYQFRAGGYILNVVTNGVVSVEWGQAITATFVILFTALGGMVAVAHTDLPNGIIIVVACIAAVPFAIAFAGGWDSPHAVLPDGHFQPFSQDFGEHPLLKAGSYFLATMMLLMGVQSMYQKFYSARSPKEAKQAVALWIVGTILVETLVVAIAIYGASANWHSIQVFDLGRQLAAEVREGRLDVAGAPARADALVRERVANGQVKSEHAAGLTQQLRTEVQPLLADPANFVREAERIGRDPASVVLVSAENIASRGGVQLVFGVLLLAAACAVVLSTGMNYLLSPTTNIMRDIYQRFINPNPPPGRMVALQKVFVVIVGLCAFLMIFIPTVMHARISVLRYSYFAYTMYGVAITPALLAALAWKRATRAGGVVSIISGAVMALLLELVIPNLFPQVMKGPAGSQDPWGVPSIYPSLAVSVLALFVVSLATPKPDPKSLQELFPEKRG